MDLLEVRDLSFGYEDINVLEKYNMHANKGEILLIEGENGAGKTTLLKCIGSIVNGGKHIYYNGKEMYSNKDLIKNISFILSEDTLYEYLTALENINFYKHLFNEDEKYMQKVNEYIKLFGIDQYLDKLVKNLSQGTRNKLYLAIMLSKSFEVLILDEPFTALDSDTQKKIIDKINYECYENKKCIIMVTHIDEFKQIATRREELKKINI